MAGWWMDSMLRWGITIIVSLPLPCPWTWTCTYHRTTMNKFSSDLFFFSLHNVSAAGGGALCKVDTNTFPPTTVPAPDYHQSIIYQQHHHQRQRFMFVCLYFLLFPSGKSCCNLPLQRLLQLCISSVCVFGERPSCPFFVCVCWSNPARQRTCPFFVCLFVLHFCSGRKSSLALHGFDLL